MPAGRRSNVVWAFDVDGTLVDSLTGMSVRPGAVELLTQLRRRHCTTVLWSAAGADYAEQRADELGVHALFDVFRGKDERGTDGRYRATTSPPIREPWSSSTTARRTCPRARMSCA